MFVWSKRSINDSSKKKKEDQVIKETCSSRVSFFKSQVSPAAA
jgi:hypothetical protein